VTSAYTQNNDSLDLHARLNRRCLLYLAKMAFNKSHLGMYPMVTKGHFIALSISPGDNYRAKGFVWF